MPAPSGLKFKGGKVKLKDALGSKVDLNVYGDSLSESEFKSIADKTEVLYSTGTVASALGLRAVGYSENYQRTVEEKPPVMNEVHTTSTLICKKEGAFKPFYISTKLPKDETLKKAVMTALKGFIINGEAIDSVQSKGQGTTV